MNNIQQDSHCDECKKITPDYDSTYYMPLTGENRLLCTLCFNTVIAEINDVEKFENVQFEPLEIIDCSGARHEFYFHRRLMGDRVYLRAFELKNKQPSGYQLEIFDSPEEDAFAMLGRMVQKIRYSLSIKYMTEGSQGLQIFDQVVQGRIESDIKAGSYGSCHQPTPSSNLDRKLADNSLIFGLSIKNRQF